VAPIAMEPKNNTQATITAHPTRFSLMAID